MTNTRPAYCVVETAPRYCPHTDGIIGSTSRVVAYYETEAFAIKRASVLNRDEDATYGGELDFHAAAVDAPRRPLFGRTVLNWTDAGVDDEIPF
jgi:hypothetical protein